MMEFIAGFLLGGLGVMLLFAGTVDRVADRRARQIAGAYGSDCVVARDGEFVWREAGE